MRSIDQIVLTGMAYSLSGLMKELLDYMLRMCKLQPLDAIWLPNYNYPDVIRVAVACRAVADVVAQPLEMLMKQSTLNVDHNIFVDTFGDTPAAQLVPFTRSDEEFLVRPDGVTCDIYATVMARNAHQPQPDEIRLRLDAMS